MPYRPLRLCSHGGGLEALPDSREPLDLGRIRTALEAAGVAVVDARVMLIASLEPDVTISRSGKLLFKTGDEALARAAMDRLFALVPSAFRGSPRRRSAPGG